MIELEIKNVSSPEGIEPSTYIPASKEQTSIYIDLAIGVKGAPAADYFGVMVETPEAARSRLKDRKILRGRHTLLVSSYDWDLIKSEIDKILLYARAPTWEEAAVRLSRHLAWEYENDKLL